ncbi:MAG: nucleotide exchange factor GrpE, partial [Candidatus Electrothrix sp. LOE2]|nr:nucleotide exchange factor GrpE [Candidatus Electrothrix sp. LOE2]
MLKAALQMNPRRKEVTYITKTPPNIVTPLNSLGKPFNPDEMDALTMEADDEIPANHVVTEFAKGYTF